MIATDFMSLVESDGGYDISSQDDLSEADMMNYQRPQVEAFNGHPKLGLCSLPMVANERKRREAGWRNRCRMSANQQAAAR